MWRTVGASRADVAAGRSARAKQRAHVRRGCQARCAGRHVRSGSSGGCDLCPGRPDFCSGGCVREAIW